MYNSGIMEDDRNKVALEEVLRVWRPNSYTLAKFRSKFFAESIIGLLVTEVISKGKEVFCNIEAQISRIFSVEDRGKDSESYLYI